MPDPQLFAAALSLVNLAAFLLFGFDKFLAKSGKRRVSENALILTTALVASPGGLLGMVVFNHKTSKAKFRYGVPALLIAHAAFAYWISYS